LAFEYEDKLKKEKDEQKQIQDEMREEEKARREIERAREDAEKEELRYQKALEKAREDVSKASGEKVNQLNDKISQLEAQLKAAQELKERAISRAQITKSGHVYIISNVGSFGENIFKIGMTRRLEPLDRVKELGDASVPFTFDVHALVYSDNAPELENKLHQQFETTRINLVNPRREFFSTSLEEIEKWAKNENIELRLTKIAEAREYRESMAIRAKGTEAIQKAIKEEIPESIENLFSKDEEIV
jgi:multidrug efflux pump subunit AcrA (membrane-fusion protein)